MKKNSFMLVLIVVFALLITGCSQEANENLQSSEPAEPTEPTRLLLGTSSVGGTYYVMGGGWAKIMNSNVPGVDISVEVTGGPTSNMQLIQDKKMELGFTTAFLAQEGFTGTGWAEGKKYDDFRALFPMYSSALHIYTLEKTGLKSISDFEGKHVTVGAPGSSSNVAGQAVLKVLGIKPSKISALPTGTATDGVKDGLNQGGFVVSGAPGPWMLDLETSHEVFHIALTKEERAKIIKELPYTENFIPAGTYKHQKEDMPVITFWNFAIASKDLPDDLVYKLVKATFDNQAELVAVNKSAKETIAENIIYSPVPLHPGAVKYYKEVGIEIPDKLLP